MENLKTEVLTFLKNNNPKLCVVATSTKQGKPECAVMAYVVHDDLSITISTHNTTRKWQNMRENSAVALTFGWDHNTLNIQYEGIALEVEQGADHLWHEELYFKEHPQLKKFQVASTIFIKTSPTWVRSTNLSVHPPQIVESTITV